MIYTVTCNPALDYTLKVQNFTAEDINRAHETLLTFGGKGINVSAVLNQLNIPTCALGFIAGGNGERLNTLLSESGVATDFIRLAEGETRINVKIKSQKEWDINAPGPRVAPQELEALMAKLEVLQAGDILALSGSIPAGLPADLYEQMLERIEGKGVLAAIDAEGALLRKTLGFKPFLVKPNHHELGELYGVKLHHLGEIEPYARKMQAEGARNVLVSCGGEGALLLDENGWVHTAQNAPGIFKSSVGCGDSMVAGFLAGWLNTADYKEALKWGTACGNATAYSDTLATREEIETILSIL